MDKLIIFGTGMDAAALMREREQTKEFYQDEVIAFCDNQKQKWHTAFFDKEILPPDAILSLEYDYVVIATTDYFYEIKAQLKEQYGLSDCKILDYLHYCIKINIQYQYARNAASDCKDAVNRFHTDKLVIYTAIQGDYDDLKDPLFTDDGITYVCFTDNKSMKSGIWNIEYVDEVSDSALGIREYKMLPHKYFKDFDTSIWVDGSLWIKNDMRDFIRQYGKGSDFLCFPHEQRRCIYDEGAKVLLLRKAPKNVIIQQMAYYLNEGYPQNNGLYLGGCMVRNHNEPAVIKIMEQWWEQVNRFSKRDQISLPYVMYKNQFHCNLCDLNLYDNEWTSVSRHKELLIDYLK